MAEIVVVLGNAGAAKSTHCAELALEGFNGSSVQHLSLGNRLRAIKTGAITSDFSDAVKTLDTLPPPPDEIVNGIMSEAIGELPDEGLILLEGYPRYAHTVDGFYDIVHSRGHALRGILHFIISRETSIKRVQARAREGEALSADSIGHKYDCDQNTTSMAILSILALQQIDSEKIHWETVEAGGTRSEVRANFEHALGKIALGNQRPANNQ